MGAGLLASSGRPPCLSDLEPPPGLTQGPLLCVRASFSQDGFYHQGVWEVDKNYRDLVPLPTLTPRSLSVHVSFRRFLDLKHQKYVVSLSVIRAGPSSSVLLPSSSCSYLCTGNRGALLLRAMQWLRLRRDLHPTIQPTVGQKEVEHLQGEAISTDMARIVL